MKSVLPFLLKLKKNNKREWMQAHKEDYLCAKGECAFLVQELIVRIREWDSMVPFWEPEDCMFRMNRDVRFSANKKPYKENFGLYISYGGKQASLPGYYINIAPKDVFVAGGLWMPEAPVLKKIRRYIDDHGAELEKIISAKSFKSTFGGLSDEGKLKRPPRGYTEESPYLDLVKNKSFVAYKSLPETTVTKANFGKQIDQIFSKMIELNHFLAKASK